MSFSYSIPFDRMRRALRAPLRSMTGDRRTAADKRLAARIADLFDQVELRDADAVSVYVRNESVVVTGVVHSDAERDLVIQVILRIPGIRRVASRIHVVGHSDAGQES